MEFIHSITHSESSDTLTMCQLLCKTLDSREKGEAAREPQSPTLLHLPGPVILSWQSRSSGFLTIVSCSEHGHRHPASFAALKAVDISFYAGIDTYSPPPSRDLAKTTDSWVAERKHTKTSSPLESNGQAYAGCSPFAPPSQGPMGCLDRAHLCAGFLLGVASRRHQQGIGGKEGGQALSPPLPVLGPIFQR